MKVDMILAIDDSVDMILQVYKVDMILAMVVVDMILT